MTTHELANKLLEGPNTELIILDGFNGGGFPREVNLGPTSRTITEEDAEEGGDCEGLIGTGVMVIGYGCY